MKSNAILVRNEENVTSTQNHSVQLNGSKVYFIRTNGDIHFNESEFNQLLQMRAKISPFCTDILYFISECTSIFINNANQLYCSRKEKHQVFIINMHDVFNIKGRIGNGERGLKPELEPVSFFATGPTGRFDLFNRTGPADNRPVDICHITGKKPVKTFKLKYHFSSQNTISVVCMFSSLRNQRKCCPFQYASKCDKNDTSYYVVFSDFIVTATL